MEKLLKTKNYKLKTNSGGFVALITVFIIISIALLVSLGFSLLSIGEIDMGFKKTQSSQAYFLANLCAEQALMKLKEDINYQGNDPPINIGDGSCQILQIEGRWIIKTIGNQQNNIKKMRISVSEVNPIMIIDYWQEVAEF